ncbi:hypothetical protein PGTDC60_1888 [Porphyromonas gingivalis TDC60]|nr:hypothetical protein PGTDC60_1888 [Porphyromonas gingivalis TDC60]
MHSFYQISNRPFSVYDLYINCLRSVYLLKTIYIQIINDLYIN